MKTTAPTGVTLERQRRSDMVAHRIRELIEDNRLLPGDRLPTEHELAGRFGVSRLAVREATKALEFLGLLEASPRRGLTVGALDLQRVTPFLQFHPTLRETTADSLIDTRIVLETGGLPWVAARMREDESICHDLCALAQQFRDVRSLAEWIELDIRFHRQLMQASGLAPLVAFHDLLEIFFQRFRPRLPVEPHDASSDWEQGVESHRTLVEALRAGDVLSACQQLRAHIESHREPARPRTP